MNRSSVGDGFLFAGVVIGLFGLFRGHFEVCCGLGCLRCPLILLGGFEVRRGNLEAVEEQAGSAGIDIVGSEAPEDLAEGVVDGGT